MENCEIQLIVLSVLLLVSVLSIICLLKQRDELRKNVVSPIDIENPQSEQ